MQENTAALIHGFAGSPASWEEVSRLLPDGVRIFAPKLGGHGVDPPPVVGFEEQVDGMAALLRREGAAGCVLCGYSLGGRVALGMLVRHPELFGRAVIIGAHPGLADDAARQERRAWEELWAQRLEREGIEAFEKAWSQLPLFDTQGKLPAASLERQRATRLSHSPGMLAQSMRRLGLGAMPDWSGHLARIQASVTFVAGALDTKFRALADVMARGVARGKSLVIEGCGHNVVLENPAAVAALLRKESSG